MAGNRAGKGVKGVVKNPLGQIDKKKNDRHFVCMGLPIIVWLLTMCNFQKFSQSETSVAKRYSPKVVKIEKKIATEKQSCGKNWMQTVRVVIKVV